MTRTLIALLTLVAAGCEFNVTTPTPTAAPGGGSTTITNTNTNTAANLDRADTEPVPASGGGQPSSPSSGALPLPAYGEGVTREVAAAHPALLAASCQTTHGESAWAWLDRVVQTLQARDRRWGYLCKDASCAKVAADVVAYQASAGDTGIWIVDVIGNHCPNPGDVVAVRWGVLPFETLRRWTGVRP
jgi:hypothetical protein